jgi:hypothetical protein
MFYKLPQTLNTDAMSKLREKSLQRLQKRSDKALGKADRVKQRHPAAGTTSDRVQFDAVTKAAERNMAQCRCRRNVPELSAHSRCLGCAKAALLRTARS